MLESSKSQPGRPRLYDSASSKVDAFRKRLETAGFVRKEILTTPPVWAEVKDLAQVHGVSASDAAAGLLELGLEAFKEKALNAASQGHLRMSAALAVGMDNPIAGTSMSLAEDPLRTNEFPESLSPSDNPITRFFNRRKEQSNVQPK